MCFATQLLYPEEYIHKYALDRRQNQLGHSGKQQNPVEIKPDGGEWFAHRQLYGCGERPR
jgi:hypothetical protein